MSFKVSGERSLFILLFFVTGILVLTLPREMYRGDAVAIRGATLSLLQSGDLAIHEELVEKNAAILTGQDQAYFIRNDADGRYFSKWGFLNTLLYIPPVAIQLLQDNELDLLSVRGDFAALVSTYNILWALALAFYLWLLSGLFVQQRGVRVVYILGCFFASFLWNFLRAQTTEIFQVFFFVAGSFHYLRWIREKEKGASGGSHFHLYATVSFWILMTWLKPYFVLLCGFWLLHFVWFEWRQAGGFVCKREHIFSFVILIAGLVILLASQHYKFNDLFATGYGRTIETDLGNRFVGDIGAGLSGFLFSSNYSVFLHFPLLLIALLAIPAFLRRHQRFYSFVLGAFLVFFLFIGKMENWAGHWSYGPRYLLFLLPVLSLPALHFFSKVWTWRGMRRAAATTCVSFLLLFGFWLQVQVNTLNFFIGYELKDEVFKVWAPHDGAIEYFESANFSRISYDLQKFRQGEGEFYPLELVKPLLKDEQIEFLEHKVRSKLWINYYWAN